MEDNLAPEKFSQSDVIAEPLSSHEETLTNSYSSVVSHSVSHSIPARSTPPHSAIEQASLEQSWALAVADVCSEVNPHIVAAYIEPLSVDVEQSNTDKFTVRGPSRLICNYVIAHYSDALRERLAHFLDAPDVVLSIIPRETPLVSSSDGSSSLRRPATPFIVKRVRPTPVEEPRQQEQRRPAQGNQQQQPQKKDDKPKVGFKFRNKR
jgi:hypothetical protein